MLSQLKDLQIDKEKWVDLNMNLEFTIDCYRLFKFKNLTCLTSVLIYEVFLLLFILILTLPIGLLIFRNFNPFLGTDISQFLLILIFSASLWLITNIYFLKSINSVQFLAKIIESIDQYNQILQTLELLSNFQLHSPHTSDVKNQDSEQLLKVLELTRESLINSLKIETMIRQHLPLKSDRYETLVQLEQNLTQLMSTDLHSSSGDYEKLFHETIQLGLSIHQDVKQGVDQFLYS